MTTARDIIKRMFGRGRDRPKPMPRQSVEHDGVDKMIFGNFTDDSPRFRKLAIEERPHITPDVEDPEPIDFTASTPEEIKEWQSKAREAKAKREQAPEYDAWENLTRDVFYSYHHASQPEVAEPSTVDPEVAHHAKILQKMVAEDDHALSRNITRDDGTAAAIATMAAVGALREALENELVEQARQSEEMAQAKDSADNAMERLESLRDEARELHHQGMPIPVDLTQAVKNAVGEKHDAQAKAVQIAQQVPAPFDKAAHDAVVNAVKAAKEAADNAAHIPTFGQGFGEGEPVYTSPEQALTIADMWANNELLRAVAELYGRLDQHMRFERAKRIVGGQDEIVDISTGDELRRLVSTELTLLSDDELEDDFYMRYLSGELLIYETVGEEHAGRGPVVLVGDESSSMSGERLVWMKAIAMALLNICRREKRDFAYVGFASGTQVHSFEFPAKKALDAQQIIDTASHFFRGGTTPIIGLQKAREIMDRAKEFKKADIVFVSDGEAGFGPEDKRVQAHLQSKGVRLHGIGIGGSFRYLEELCDDLVNVHDFELENPSEATAHLATHVT